MYFENLSNYTNNSKLYFRESFLTIFRKSFKLYDFNSYYQCDIAFVNQSLLSQPEDWKEFQETDGSSNIIFSKRAPRPLVETPIISMVNNHMLELIQH